jgi:hypothetical protein
MLHTATPPAARTRTRRGPLVRALAVATTAIAMACVQPRPAGVFDLDLHPDARYERSVEFPLLGLRVPLGADFCVRYAGIVDDLDRCQHELLRDVGIDPANVTWAYTNAATNGRTFALRFRNGVHAAFVMVRRQPDARLTSAVLEHERYHALAALDAASLPLVHERLAQLGFTVPWSELDEELRATVVEVVALHQQGIPLAAIGGSELVVAALDLLRRRAPDRPR